MPSAHLIPTGQSRRIGALHGVQFGQVSLLSIGVGDTRRRLEGRHAHGTGGGGERCMWGDGRGDGAGFVVASLRLGGGGDEGLFEFGKGRFLLLHDDVGGEGRGGVLEGG